MALASKLFSSRPNESINDEIKTIYSDTSHTDISPDLCRHIHTCISDIYSHEFHTTEHDNVLIKKHLSDSVTYQKGSLLNFSGKWRSSLFIKVDRTLADSLNQGWAAKKTKQETRELGVTTDVQNNTHQHSIWFPMDHTSCCGSTTMILADWKIILVVNFSLFNQL